ncbi:WapI family immunity protein [Frondihabitans cladoniiphilus]
MMLRSRESEDFVEVTPLGYESATGPTDPDTDEWLVIRIRARQGAASWEVTFSCLLAGEAQMLAHWLRGGATRIPDGPRPQWGSDPEPQLTFSEPHLGFALATGTTTALLLRVFLAYEADQPATDTEPDWWDSDTRIDLPFEPVDLVAAAAAFLHELRPFPRR